MQNKLSYKVLIVGVAIALFVLATFAVFRFKFIDIVPPAPTPPTPYIPELYFQGGDLRNTPVERLYDNLVAPNIAVVPGTQLIRFLDKSSNKLVEFDTQSRLARPLSDSFENKIKAVEWSPSTKKALIFQRGMPNQRFSLVVYDTETRSVAELNNEFVNFVWKDDNTLWANRYFMPPENTQNAILEIDANSGAVLRTVFSLPLGLQQAVVGSFSANRNLFAFAGHTATIPQDIFLYNLTDGAITKLTSHGTNVMPEFSPDNKWIVYYNIDNPRAIDGVELRAMRADGSGDRSLGIRTAQFFHVFIAPSTILAVASAKMPEDCPGAYSDHRCFVYGEIIALNNIAAANIESGASRLLLLEEEWGSFGLPRVSVMRQVGTSIVFLDLRDNKLYALNNIL